MTPTRMVIIVGGILACASLITGRFNHSDDLKIVPVEERTRPQERSYPSLAGGKWTLSENRGKWVVVNYWATWCGPCVEETPTVVRLANKLRAKGVEFVGVSLDTGPNSLIQRFADHNHMTYLLLRGDADPALSIGIPIPTTVVFDPKGREALSTTGPLDEAQFETTLDALLKE